MIDGIHDEYFAAGADVATTNTFTRDSHRPGRLRHPRARPGHQPGGGKVAREVADRWTAKDPSRPRFVAGSLGPLNRTLSISPSVDDASLRTVTFDQVRDAYAEQVRALIDGGVDILLIETIFDTLNARPRSSRSTRRSPRWASSCPS